MQPKAVAAQGVAEAGEAVQGGGGGHATAQVIEKTWQQVLA